MQVAACISRKASINWGELPHVSGQAMPQSFQMHIDCFDIRWARNRWQFACRMTATRLGWNVDKKQHFMWQ